MWLEQNTWVIDNNSINIDTQETNTENLIISIEKIKEIYWDLNIWFEEFENFLLNISDNDLQQDIINLFIKSSWRDKIILKKYIKKNWFPNSETIDFFIKKFNIKWNHFLNLINQEVSDTNQEVSIEIEQLRLIRSSLLDDNGEYIWNFDSEFILALENTILDSVNAKSLETYLNIPWNLEKILTELLSIDKLRGISIDSDTSMFSRVTSSLVSYNPNFWVRIISYIEWLDRVEKSEWIVRSTVTASLYKGDIEVDGVYIRSWDICVDMSKEPPSRHIWWEFTLESELNVWNFYEATVYIERERQKLIPEKNKLEFLMKPEVQEHIDDMKKGWSSFLEIKVTLNQVYGIDFDNNIDEIDWYTWINSLEDMSILNLENKLD